MDSLQLFITYAAEPFSSGLFALLLLCLLLAMSRKAIKPSRQAFLIAGLTTVFWVTYRVFSLNENAALWLGRLNSPIFLIAIILVLPAVFLPDGKWRKLHLILPVVSIMLLVIEIAGRYSRAPADTGFMWFTARPLFVIAAFAGFLVIGKRFLSLNGFRKLTRITMFALLIYGGFAFRQTYTDYREMLARRKDANPDMMLIAETVPVLKSDEQVTHVPGAPCRFSADGGYVQGCPMELLQRTAQVNLPLAARGDVGESSVLGIAIAALVFVSILAFIGARWWCGWILPPKLAWRRTGCRTPAPGAASSQGLPAGQTHLFHFRAILRNFRPSTRKGLSAT
jgi:hypothetical protein